MKKLVWLFRKGLWGIAMAEKMHSITKHIATLGESGFRTLELNKVAWGYNPPKYDIRHWVSDEPLKGICFDQNEATALYYALGQELGISK